MRGPIMGVWPWSVTSMAARVRAAISLVRSIGLCDGHRWQQAQGRPLTPITRHLPVVARFWSKVDRTDTCWLWTGAKDPKGYGRYRLRPSVVFAHRYAYALVNGEPPEGLVLDHLCRTPACVRPDHLEAVPQLVNVLRGQAGTVASARYAEHLHCPKGHPLFGPNLYLYITKRGRKNKQCRTCKAVRDRERKARLKETA